MTNPNLLASYFENEANQSASQILAEATLWVSESLALGNVLVHCEKGQRRSPTIILAFLISQGLRLGNAFRILEAGLEADWADRYKRTREKWVTG